MKSLSKRGSIRGSIIDPKNTKPPVLKRVMNNKSGVGGNRTLVQTSNRRAFYTLSFYLIFELRLTKNGPPLTLLPLLKS